MNDAVERKIKHLLNATTADNFNATWAELRAAAPFLPSNFTHLPTAEAVAALNRSLLMRASFDDGIHAVLVEGVL